MVFRIFSCTWAESTGNGCFISFIACLCCKHRFSCFYYNIALLSCWFINLSWPSSNLYGFLSLPQVSCFLFRWLCHRGYWCLSVLGLGVSWCIDSYQKYVFYVEFVRSLLCVFLYVLSLVWCHFFIKGISFRSSIIYACRGCFFIMYHIDIFSVSLRRVVVPWGR